LVSIEYVDNLDEEMQLADGFKDIFARFDK